MSFAGKTALITGGTGALGQVVVTQFLEAGAAVAIPYHSTKSADALISRLGSDEERTLLSQTDLTSESQVDDLIHRVEKRFGGIHFLVNLAGGYAGGNPVHDVPIKEWDQMINLNLTTTFLSCRAALRVMRARKFGRIVNTAAMHAVSPAPNKGPYAISKAGVVTLTQTIAEEVKGSGITCNVIAPSIILTEQNKRSMPAADFSKWVPPEEIAKLIVYLCSDVARSINGNLIKIYGGV